MGKVHFLDPVDYISGKISKNRCTCYNYRSSINNLGEHRRYTSQPTYNPNRPLSESEKAARQRFAAVRMKVLERAQNPATQLQDMKSFAAQTEYKTLYAYRWHLAAQEYDAQNG